MSAVALSAAAAPATPTRAPATPRARFTTPRIIRLLYAAVVVLAGSVALVGWLAVARARTAMVIVGHDTAPAIIAAQEVSAALADLDANEANYLLVTDALARDQALQLFEFRRAIATKRLVDAAAGASSRDSARASIVLAYENLGRYVEAASAARQAADRGDAAAALDAYRVATDVMHGRILVDTQDLDEQNHELMEQKYAEQQRGSEAMEALAVLTGVLLAFALFVLQVFFLVRTRRIFNPALFLAMVLAVGYTSDLHRRIADAREDLRVAKADSFDSIDAIWQARAKAYDAHGDQSRWLLDRAHAGSWQASFAANVATLSSDPELAPPAPRDLAAGRNVEFAGLFAKELNNVTFVGEREAATAMVKGFAAYYALDDTIRALEKEGNHAGAVATCLGSSNDAFGAFDAAALRTLDINQNVFDAVLAAGEGSLASAAWLHPLLALIVVVAAWLGVRPRLREYAS